MVEKILRKIAKKCIILMKINKKVSKIAQFSSVISFLLRIDANFILKLPDKIFSVISFLLRIDACIHTRLNHFLYSVISFLLRIDAINSLCGNVSIHLQCNIVLIKD